MARWPKPMASTISELFGYDAGDDSPAALGARSKKLCPFIGTTCTKRLSDGQVSGVCSIEMAKSGPVICCPNRLYAHDYSVLKEISVEAFGPDKTLVAGDQIKSFTASNPGKSCVAVFGKRWGKELRLPNRSKAGNGAYFVDWILASVDPKGKLENFVAVEVQSIDTTGNYRAARKALLSGGTGGKTTAGLNWENVNKRILPQLIYKGHVLRQEPLCSKGLFFVCPTAVKEKILERLGGKLSAIHMQPGSLTIRWYDIDETKAHGKPGALKFKGSLTSTIDQVALAFTSPSNLPPAGVYEQAIRDEL